MPLKGHKVKSDPICKSRNFRANDETIKRLEYVSQRTSQSKSEVIRKGIDIQYEQLKEKNG